MRKQLLIVLAIMIFFIGTVCSVNAALFVRGVDSAGNQLIYDSDLDITWYDYTNTAPNWWAQTSWADTLTIDFGSTVYDDWRLPTINPSTWWVLSGELGHLYYDVDIDLFSNVVKDGSYWSGVISGYPDHAWVAYFHQNWWGNPSQTYKPMNWSYLAIAVRDGDVAAPIPEPCTMLLLGTGLVGIGFYHRKKGQQDDKD